MFAPHHQAAADEVLRVLRPGGRLGLLSWTPEGFIGQVFAVMKPYAPPPPPGVQPPPLWGREDHVRALLGDRVTDIRARKGLLRVERFTDGAGLRDYFKHKYGPCIAAYRNVADDPERTAALDRDLADVARRHDLGGGAMEWEYLLVTARVAR
jgi:SAM-dependent methyltransferase